MTLRTIATLPDPILRRKARPVTTFDQNLQTLIDDMIETMREAPGVGLAAPQVSVSQRVIVVEYAEHDEPERSEEHREGEAEIAIKPRLYVVVNPEIGKVSQETLPGVEGCLSIPGIIGEVERHAAIQVKGLNRHGKPFRLKAQGWLARIFQHEIDHLDSVLFPDRATRVWKPEADEVNTENEV